MAGKLGEPVELETRRMVYEFVVRFKREHDGLSPTFREIGKGLYMAHSLVFYHVKALEEAGKLRVLGEGRTRGIMVTGGRWDLRI